MIKCFDCSSESAPGRSRCHRHLEKARLDFIRNYDQYGERRKRKRLDKKVRDGLRLFPTGETPKQKATFEQYKKEMGYEGS